MPSRRLGIILRAWAKTVYKLEQELTQNSSVFRSFRKALFKKIEGDVAGVSYATQKLQASMVLDLDMTASKQIFKIAQQAYDTAKWRDSMLSVVKWIDTLRPPAISQTLLDSLKPIEFPGLSLNLSDTLMQLQRTSTHVSQIINQIKITEPGQIAALSIGKNWADQVQLNYAALGKALNVNPSVANNIRSLLEGAQNISQTFSFYYLEIDFAKLVTSDLALQRTVIPPPLVTAHLINSVRTLGFPSSEGPSQSAVVIDKSTGNIEVEVKELLAHINASLVLQWEGAWQSLRSKNADHLRQAAHSAREVLRQILDLLAPDDRFSAEDIAERGVNNQPTRKMRISYILGAKSKSSRVEWVEAVARLGNELYSDLSARAHGDPFDVTAREVRACLIAVGGVLVNLLTDRQ